MEMNNILSILIILVLIFVIASLVWPTLPKMAEPTGKIGVADGWVAVLNRPAVERGLVFCTNNSGNVYTNQAGNVVVMAWQIPGTGYGLILLRNRNGAWANDTNLGYVVSDATWGLMAADLTNRGWSAALVGKQNPGEMVLNMDDVVSGEGMFVNQFYQEVSKAVTK
jgi:hypothetical protein